MLAVSPPTKTLKLRDYQEDSLEQLRTAMRCGHKRVVLCAPTGSGKCLAPGTTVVMADGRVLPVEDIVDGDLLMGPDGSPRTVTGTVSGVGPMVEIVPTKGRKWRCTADHILTLVRGHDGTGKAGELVDIPVSKWQASSKWFRSTHYLLRTGWELPNRSLPIHPWALGILIGDGSLASGSVSFTTNDYEIVRRMRRLCAGTPFRLSEYDYGDRSPSYALVTEPGKNNALRNSIKRMGLNVRAGDKFIPSAYMLGSIDQRLQLLAGLMDSDGHLAPGYFDFISKSVVLAAHVAQLARSCGFGATMRPKLVKYKGSLRAFYRVSVIGDVNRIPCVLERKKAGPRRQIKSVMRTSFTVRDVGDGPWHGFSLDGDGRFLLGDGTITHNTEIALALIQAEIEKNSRVAFIADRQILVTQTSKRAWDYGIEHGILMGSQTKGTFENIRICSAQTLESRGMHDVDLVIADECHVRRQKIIKHVVKHNIPTIGLSATPMAPWMGDVFEYVVNATTTNDLTEAGHLVPLRVLAPDSQVRTKGLKASTGGEWARSDVSKRVMEVVGDAVSEWQKLINEKFDGIPQPTIAFAASVADSEALAKQFRDAGHDFAVLSYKQDSETKDAIIQAFREGRHTGLVSCAVLERGFDAPETRIMIDCYPVRKSLMTVLQRYGRVIRSAPGKTEAWLLDHSGNYLGFESHILHFNEHGVERLGDKRFEKATRKKNLKRKEATCHACHAVYEPRAKSCHVCGAERLQHDPPHAGSNTIRINGKLVTIDSHGRPTGLPDGYLPTPPKSGPGPKLPYIPPDLYSQLYTIARDKKEHEAAKKQALAQFRSATGRWPARGEPKLLEPGLVDQVIWAWVKESSRQYGIRRSYARRKTDRDERETDKIVRSGEWDEKLANDLRRKAGIATRTRTQFDKGYRHSPR